MIYADYASTTPMDAGVLEDMMPYLTSEFYNPSSIYPKGIETKTAIQQSRKRIADILGANEKEIIFTSGGTESNNLAIKGVATHPENSKRHIITTQIEHHSVLNPCKYLEDRGYRVSYLPVSQNGIVAAQDLEKLLCEDTLLVSVMYINNEIGSIQNIKELCGIAHNHGALFHTDAVQAFCTEALDVSELGVDLLSISAHKFYGPKGIGLLYYREGVKLQAQIQGGQQEGHMRGGTEPVAQIIGMAKAAELVKMQREDLTLKLKRQKDIIIQRVCGLKDIIINGKQSAACPSIINIGFKDIEAEGIVFKLAMEGIMVSMGAACNTASIEPSHVLKAIGVDSDYLRGCIRISLGKNITDEDCYIIADNLIKIINSIRNR